MAEASKIKDYLDLKHIPVSNWNIIYRNICREEVSFAAFEVSSNELLKEIGFLVGARALILSSFSCSETNVKPSSSNTVAQSFGFGSRDNTEPKDVLGLIGQLKSQRAGGLKAPPSDDQLRFKNTFGSCASGKDISKLKSTREVIYRVKIWNEKTDMYVPVGRERDYGFAARKFSTPLNATYDEVFNFAANFFGDLIKRKGYKIDSLNSNFGGKITRKNFENLGEWMNEQKKFSLAISGYMVIELCVSESDENSDDDVVVIESREAEAVVGALISASTSNISENVAVENQTMKIPRELEVETQYVQVRQSVYSGAYSLTTVFGDSGALDLYQRDHGIGADFDYEETYEETGDSLLSHISKGNKVFLEVIPHQKSPMDDFTFETTYPSAKDLSKMILHGPVEVHGYGQGGSRFALYCIYNDKIARVMKWYLNGKRIFDGCPVYSRVVSKPGIYKVVVGNNDETISETVYAQVKNDENGNLQVLHIKVSANQLAFPDYPSAAMVSTYSGDGNVF